MWINTFMETIKNNRIHTFICFSLFLIVISPANISAELQVEINIPKLKDGMSQVEALLAANITLAIVEIEKMANESLEKPLITRACGAGSGFAGTLGTTGYAPNPGEMTFSTGLIAGVESDTFDYDDIEERFDNLEPEDDYPLGAGARGVSCTALIPLSRLLPGLHISASGSYVDLSEEDYFINGVSLGLSAGYSIFRNIERGIVRWTPVEFRIGGGFGKNSFGTTVSAGKITETFDIDPDGSGPFPSQSISIEVEPEIDIALETEIWDFTAAVLTGINIADFISFYAGGGGVYMTGKTGISAESSSDIHVLGYLSELIEKEGSIDISGEVEGEPVNEFSTFIHGGIRFDFGQAFLNIPVFFRPPDGLAGGVTMGIEF